MTVTELLSGQRLPRDQSLPMRDVEALVGGALHLTAEEQARQREHRQMWGGRYVLAALALALEVFFLRNVIPIFADSAVMLWFPSLFGAGFGVYFIFLAKEKLPSFYDQYKINFYSDGILRMNVAGVHFNNRNWPHILLVLRRHGRLGSGVRPAVAGHGAAAVSGDGRGTRPPVSQPGGHPGGTVPPGIRGGEKI